MNGCGCERGKVPDESRLTRTLKCRGECVANKGSCAFEESLCGTQFLPDALHCGILGVVGVKGVAYTKVAQSSSFLASKVERKLARRIRGGLLLRNNKALAPCNLVRRCRLCEARRRY